jgi:protein-S-isoprenylcysteine O-methyltransferase Ste14
MLQPSPLWTLGLTFTVCGGLLRIRAIKDLGRFFTMEPDIAGDHNLITTGSFSIVRQPGYAGLILARMGMDSSSYHLERGLEIFFGRNFTHHPHSHLTSVLCF